MKWDKLSLYTALWTAKLDSGPKLFPPRVPPFPYLLESSSILASSNPWRAQQANLSGEGVESLQIKVVSKCFLHVSVSSTAYDPSFFYEISWFGFPNGVRLSNRRMFDERTPNLWTPPVDVSSFRVGRMQVWSGSYRWGKQQGVLWIVSSRYRTLDILSLPVDVLEIFRRPGNEVNFISRKLAISNMIFLLFRDNNINKHIGNFYAIHLMIYIS